MVISFSFLSLNYFVSTKGKAEKRVLYANKSLTLFSSAKPVGFQKHSVLKADVTLKRLLMRKTLKILLFALRLMHIYKVHSY